MHVFSFACFPRAAGKVERVWALAGADEGGRNALEHSLQRSAGRTGIHCGGRTRASRARLVPV